MKKILQEPLLHFLFLGMLLFASNAWRESGMPKEDDSRSVRISENDVRWLKETWLRQWQREPTEPELRGMVTDYLQESLLAQEALEMGLEKNDTIIRRRLAQKLEFLVQDTAQLAEPGEDELLRFYEERRTEYQIPARVSFAQLYFTSEDAARKALAQLATRNPDELGEWSLLARDHVRADWQTLAAQFGKEFAAAVFGLGAGSWQGPLASAYGFHLVCIDALEEARSSSLAEVHGQVLEDYHREQRARAKELFYATLLKKYDVVADESIKPLLRPVAN